MKVIIVLLLLGFSGDTREHRIAVPVPTAIGACNLLASLRYWSPEAGGVASVIAWAEDDNAADGAIHCPPPAAKPVLPGAP